jgi:hypothetical protein
MAPLRRRPRWARALAPVALLLVAATTVVDALERFQHAAILNDQPARPDARQTQRTAAQAGRPLPNAESSMQASCTKGMRDCAMLVRLLCGRSRGLGNTALSCVIPSDSAGSRRLNQPRRRSAVSRKYQPASKHQTPINAFQHQEAPRTPTSSIHFANHAPRLRRASPCLTTRSSRAWPSSTRQSRTPPLTRSAPQWRSPCWGASTSQCGTVRGAAGGGAAASGGSGRRGPAASACRAEARAASC